MLVKEAMYNIAQRIGVLGLKIKAASQSKPYGDSEYEWELTTKEDIDEAELLAFCQRFLRKNTQTYEEWRRGQNDSATVHFRGYYKLTRRSAKSWVYEVVEPYCD